MKITVGGVVVQSSSPTLREAITAQIEVVEEQIKKCNRNTRRHKLFKKVLTVFGMTTLVAHTSIAHAKELADSPIADVGSTMGEKVVDGMIKRLSEGVMPTEGFAKEDSFIWRLNEFASHTILTTKDYFGAPEIVHMFSGIWYIVMSFSTLIIAKKGFDMVKARTMGTSSIGLGDMLIRLVASLVITFLSLDVIQLGIEGSNLLVKTLFSNFTKGFVNPEAVFFSPLENLFWLIGYIFLFGILMIRYWIRQIEIIILGLIAPIASMSSVVDGGRMLGTLVKEMVQLLTTPIVHGALLVTGGVLIELSASEDGWLSAINSLGISFATMVLMIVTPEFLRKFTHGSINPLKFALDMASGVKALPSKMKGLIK